MGDIKKLSLAIVSSMLVIVMMAPGTNAQGAMIMGHVYNETGSPLEGVNVTWEDAATSKLYDYAITVVSGGYAMSDTFSGQRDSLITATKSGYYPNSTVMLINGTTPPSLYTVDFMLQRYRFDTGTANCTYPSISGEHTGTLTPFHAVYVQRMYTYPCGGTAGHTEYVAFYHNGVEVATWKGYRENYNYVKFEEPFELEKGVTYNYTIITGSYPQIIHNQSLTTTDGILRCIQFTDVNGNVYNNWIPAIRLEPQNVI